MASDISTLIYTIRLIAGYNTVQRYKVVLCTVFAVLIVIRLLFLLVLRGKQQRPRNDNQLYVPSNADVDFNAVEVDDPPVTLYNGWVDDEPPQAVTPDTSNSLLYLINQRIKEMNLNSRA